VAQRVTEQARTKTSDNRRKTIEEVVRFALSHPIRIEILTLLNEAVYTPNELAEILDEPLTNVTYHVTELAEAGSIELARTEPVRNWTRHYYRAVEQPYVSEEEALAMSPQQRQIMAGVTLQCTMAELIAGFNAGNMIDDPRNVLLAWRWFNLDREGQEETMTELVESWERIQSIQARSASRCAQSGEKPVSMIVAMQGFKRHRFSRNSPIALASISTPHSEDTE